MAVKKWDVVLTGVLVACALLTTGLVIRREFFVDAPAQLPAPAKPVFIEEWRGLLDAAITTGPHDAPVHVIEFADFECPFCASFHNTLRAVKQQYPGKIAVSFVHFPLPGHRFAEPAARVAECAAEQGRFEVMHDALFAQQREFGLKPWLEFANEAGVADVSAFDACTKRNAPIPRVQAGQKAGEQIDVKGTPTVIINGWKLSQPPQAKQLEQMIEAILEGKAPVS